MLCTVVRFRTNISPKKNIESQMDKEIDTRKKYWKDLLKRILAVVLFLGERGLAFRGSSDKIDDPNNGNFLGIIQLLISPV